MLSGGMKSRELNMLSGGMTDETEKLFVRV